MLAKCISTNCPKSSLCKRALSDSTAHVNYKYAGCDTEGEYMWHTEIEKTVSESESESEVNDENSKEN